MARAPPVASCRLHGAPPPGRIPGGAPRPAGLAPVARGEDDRRYGPLGRRRSRHAADGLEGNDLVRARIDPGSPVHGDRARVRYRRVAETDGAEVAYADIAKGYELPDGEVVVLTDDDLADLPVASSKIVDVHSFVPLDQIDPTALSRAYYAEPTADPKPYVLLRDALERSGRVAVVKVSLRNRERLAVLRPRDGVLVLQTMLWPDELRRPEFRFLDEGVDVRAQEMAMAESYIETLSDDFDPEAYVDDYRRALEEVVQAKIEGKEVTPAPAAPEGGTVVDLMEALRQSVAEARRQRGEEEPDSATSRGRKKTAATKTAAKRSAASKSTSSSRSTKKTAAKKKSTSSRTRRSA
jgi:DNA end-binding protein Ku